MKNTEIAERLLEIADFLEIQEVEYKPRAYRRAARNVESLSEDIEAVHERGELEEIDGVGESIAEKIAEYLETGEIEYYEELRAGLPIDIEAITSVEGVGPKTAKTLYEELGVSTLEELERAAEEGRIAEVEGFGETSQENILEHLEIAKRGQERMLRGRAFPIARNLRERLEDSERFDRVDVVGSFRRQRVTVGDLDVLATASDPGAAIEAFTGHEDVKEVLAEGGTKASVLVGGDLQIDLRIVDPAEYGAALIYFTGSKQHNIALRNRAIDRDWKLNEYGLFDVGDLVICVGGGGVPVTRNGGLEGTEAVVDKDKASQVLATELGATALVILTDVEYAYVNFEERDQRPLRDVSPDDLRIHLENGDFAEGSMKPKVEACLEFADPGGELAAIADPSSLVEALAGEAGTRVTA